MWAGAHDVAVGEPLVGLLVVILHRCLLDKLALVVERLEEIAGCAVVHGTGGAAIDVERDAELRHRLLDDGVIAVDDVLGRDALVLCLDGDGYAVLVAAANHHHVLAAQAQVACVDVGRNIHSSQVSDVHRTVGIGQSGGYQCAFKVFSHCFCICLRWAEDGLTIMLKIKSQNYNIFCKPASRRSAMPLSDGLLATFSAQERCSVGENRYICRKYSVTQLHGY